MAFEDVIRGGSKSFSDPDFESDDWLIARLGRLIPDGDAGLLIELELGGIPPMALLALEELLELEELDSMPEPELLGELEPVAEPNALDAVGDCESAEADVVGNPPGLVEPGSRRLDDPRLLRLVEARPLGLVDVAWLLLLGLSSPGLDVPGPPGLDVPGPPGEDDPGPPDEDDPEPPCGFEPDAVTSPIPGIPNDGPDELGVPPSPGVEPGCVGNSGSESTPPAGSRFGSEPGRSMPAPPSFEDVPALGPPGG